MAATQSQKNYLFVSNHCQHSKRLLSRLQKTPLIDTFNIVNVDDPRLQLPSFVSCVPTLYIPTKRYVLTDKELFQWFDDQFQQQEQNVGKVNIADITGDANILPFQTSEMGNGLSGSAYSFIEEEKNDLMNQNYSFLVDRDINRMPDFTRHDSPNNESGSIGGSGGGRSGYGGNQGNGTQQRKTGGDTEKAYEMMMRARGGEMNRQIPSTPNFSSPY